MAVTISGTSGITTPGYNLVPQSVQTSNFAASAGFSYPVDTTSGAVTVTLPASPSAGNQINVFDYAGTAATNSITINPNGGKINGNTAGAVVATARTSVTLGYVDSTQGWVAISAGSDSYIPLPIYSISYLIAAGGGGGAGTAGQGGVGGGGAGGLLTGTQNITIGTTYSVIVGSGGPGGSSSPGTQGGNSSAFSLVAIGGGYGGGGVSGGSGGSGGGGTETTAGGSGTSGQGYAGGAGASIYGGGGGGGAGAVGTAGASNAGGSGGSGVSSSITGSAVYYAGGGGGTCYPPAGGNGSGGTGGGGAGNGTAGTINTGGGGGAKNTGTAGAGGSGVVILSVPTAKYSGITTGSPTVTTSGSNTIIKFTASGSYTA